VKNQIRDFLVRTWPPPFAQWFRVAFGLDELSVPTQNRVGLRNCRNLSQSFSTKSVALDCQEASLLIGKQNPIASDLLAKYLILQLEVIDDQLLLIANVLDEYSNEDMKRLEDK